MYKRQVDSYTKSRKNVNEPGKVIVLLYESMLTYLRKAVGAIERKQYIEAHENISHAKLIISELNRALNRDQKGSIVYNLTLLYNYLFDRLTEANLQKDVKLLEEAIKIVSNLYVGWVKAVKQNHIQPVNPEINKGQLEIKG